ncbi:unnamed protein product [Dracunculus medinensis]|uniref:CA domain-containing protein n=1 Tax=Dracunculus medinensis TaxID=318479 RepID=A0A0N4UKR3_DRAME|nr:unnamed protein product [Dracunculus medinensis]
MEKRIASIITGDDVGPNSLEISYPYRSSLTSNGDLTVEQPLDYETISPEDRIFDVILIAGIEPYDTVARLKIELVDIDDNPPKLEIIGDLDLNNLTVVENSPPGTILFEVLVTDADYLYGKKNIFEYTLSGEGSTNFQVREINYTVAVVVSPAADLNREKCDSIFLTLQVKDSGDNSDSISAYVRILDVNDNIPVFASNDYKIQVVENWPIGTVLTSISAIDRDLANNGSIQYSLNKNTGEYFVIDENIGVLRTARLLIGMARTQPYEIFVTASDEGVPPLSSSTKLTIHITESLPLSREGRDNDIQIVDPPVDFILYLDENTPSNQHIYTVRAKSGNFNEQSDREIKYSLAPVDDIADGGWFTIDSTTGEVFTLTTLDREIRTSVTLLLFLVIDLLVT